MRQRACVLACWRSGLLIHDTHALALTCLRGLHARFAKSTVLDGMPQWSYNNPALAKEEIRTKKYVNVPPEGAIRADRKYTQEFIRKNVEAYQASRNQASTERYNR